MPDTTPSLSLPLLLPAQAQAMKHVTHNEALLLLDLLAWLGVIGRSRMAPLVSPAEGDLHIVAPLATGDWAGELGRLATWWQVGWTFLSPRDGWRAWDLDQGEEVVLDGGQWLDASARPLRVSRLGVNADADTTSRLAVNAPTTLLNHDCAANQLKLNKADPGDTASLIYQTGFSGRAEMGLAGNDDFAVKVSPDGTAWTTALSVNRTTGAVALPAGAAVTGQITGTAITQGKQDTTAGRLTKVGDFGLGAFNFSDLSPESTDLPIRFFRTNAAISGFGAGGHTIHLSRAQNAQGAQIAVRDSTSAQVPLAAVRHREGAGVWSSWNVPLGRLNLLGAVTQSGGVPTGAAIERGSNANGEFVRFADGTLICTRTNLSAANASTALGSLFASANIAWTFPATFVAAPVVTGAVDNADCWLAVAVAPTTTSVSLRAIAAVTKATAMTVRAQAVGRWF